MSSKPSCSRALSRDLQQRRRDPLRPCMPTFCWSPGQSRSTCVKRVLSPRLAVVWAALFNFLAAFFLGTAVAKTIGSGMIRLEFVDQYVVLAGLFGAIAWDLLTWWWGLPTSSSHALIGGYAGAAMSRAAFRYGVAAMPNVIIPHGWTKTLIFIVVAPMMGLVLVSLWLLAMWQGERSLRGLQLRRNHVERMFANGWKTSKNMSIMEAPSMFVEGAIPRPAFPPTGGWEHVPGAG